MDATARAKQLFLDSLGFIEAGDSASAESVLLEANRLMPNRVSILANLSAVKLQLGKYREAKFFAEQAIAHEASNVSAWTNLGTCSMVDKVYLEAESQYSTALAGNPDYVPALLGKGSAFKGQALLPEAEEYFRRALTLSPINIDALANLNSALFDQGLGQVGEAVIRSTRITNKQNQEECKEPLHPPLEMASENKILDLFVMCGQSNMQGYLGDANHFPKDGISHDVRIPLYWVTLGDGGSSSDWQWTHLQPQNGRFKNGHFGPEITFARNLADNGFHPAIFKYVSVSPGLSHSWRGSGDGRIFDAMVVELLHAISLLEGQGYKARIRGLIWIQGEGDSENSEWSAAYGQQLRSNIHYFRDSISKNSSLPCLLGLNERHPTVRANGVVKLAQLAIAAEDQYVSATSMDGLESGDEAHLAPAGIAEHGKRLAEEFQMLLSGKSDQESVAIRRMAILEQIDKLKSSVTPSSTSIARPYLLQKINFDEPRSPLENYRNNVTSQDGEDGIIERIFEIVPATSKYCVEFGAWDGKYCSNSWNLLVNKGWRGLMIEGNAEKHKELCTTYEGYAVVDCLNRFVDFDGKNSLDNILAERCVPTDLDLISIDVDGVDYFIWESMTKYHPKVVVIEFNPTIPNDVIFVQPKSFDVSQGCSLLALTALGKRKGYELVCCTKWNAFFVRKEFYQRFGLSTNHISVLYRPLFDGRIFHGYDSTIFTVGMDRLMWNTKVLSSSNFQVLPASERKFGDAQR